MEVAALENTQQQTQFVQICCNYACEEKFTDAKKIKIKENFIKLDFQARVAFISAFIAVES